MKQFLTAFLIVCALGLTLAQTKSSVTFRVNMGPAAAAGKLDVAKGNAFLSGSMNGWSPTTIPLVRTNSTTDTVYSVTLADMVVDSVYEYKFLAGSGWELLDGNDDIHRKYKVKANANDNILPVVYFSNDSTYPKYSPKPIKISFKCNMELDIAKGAFNPSTDLVSVRAGFNGWAEGASVMKKPLSGTIFSFDTTMSFIPEDNFEYVYTYNHNGNITWESANAKLVITEDEYNAAQNTELRFFDNGDTKSTITGYTLYLTTNCKNAMADIGGVKKPFPNGIKNIAVMGTEFPMVWPAIGWPDADANRLLYMYDNGQNGDFVANDSIWTLKIDYPKGALLKIAYKYGINYGLPDDNAGSNDNEIFLPGGDANHWLIIENNSITEVRTYDVWGTLDTVHIVTAIDDRNGNLASSYSLDQNYPNPFNPSTTIRYSIPEEGLVTVKVFNMLGQEVASLVNEVKPASQYSVNFDASNLSSGLYIYRINAKNFTASKKMMLLK